MSENTPAVRLEDVSKAFGGRPVLRDLSFEVECGEAFCLLGRSGTGKSVTLKLIIGLLKADTGRVFIEGNDIGAMSGADLSAVRKRVGFLFQNAALFDSISVAENLAFPLRRHTKKRPDEIESIVHEKLKQVELENDGDKMPADLSGGMRKRAGLARALVLDPPILLVDEPSSGLDRITAREIDELLSRLKNQEKRMLIIVTHDVTGARQFADRMAVLDKEKIVATDTPDRLEQSENQLVRELVTGAQR
jgi:phospholipid/cholesterol/gamma-HCH transport system ATP-binding protein